jgi:hypothetical protein
MPNLKSSIAALAEDFSAGVLAAIRSASLEEILSEGGAKRSATPTKRGPGRPRKAANGGTTMESSKPAKRGKGGRLARRSPEDIESVIGLITKALADAGKGLRSEEIQKALKLDKKEITGPLAQALAAKKISKKGEKRATTYFAK